jgi:hypothetical protein
MKKNYYVSGILIALAAFGCSAAFAEHTSTHSDSMFGSSASGAGVRHDSASGSSSNISPADRSMDEFNTRMVQGTIVSIDNAAGTMRVKNQNGKIITVADPKMRGNNTMEKGQTVSYYEM